MLSQEVHQSQADVENWADSLFSDGPVVSDHHAPATPPARAEGSPQRQPSEERVAGKKRTRAASSEDSGGLDHEKWVQMVLNASPEHSRGEHASPVRSRSVSVSSLDPALSVKTEQRKQRGPYNKPRLDWVNRYGSEEQNAVRKAVDELAESVYAKEESQPGKRRRRLMLMLKQKELDQLAKLGLMASTSAQFNKGEELINKERKQRRNRWNQHLSSQDEKTINEFMDQVMALRTGTSPATRSLLMAKLNKQELDAIARNDTAERARIMKKLTPRWIRDAKSFRNSSSKAAAATASSSRQGAGVQRSAA
jgi:hypothetical protein